MKTPPQSPEDWDALIEYIDAMSKSDMRDDALLYAIKDTVILLEARVAGVSVEVAAKALEERRKAWHQRLLETMEKVSPERAAELDDRNLEDV